MSDPNAGIRKTSYVNAKTYGISYVYPKEMKLGFYPVQPGEDSGYYRYFNEYPNGLVLAGGLSENSQFFRSRKCIPAPPGAIDVVYRHTHSETSIGKNNFVEYYKRDVKGDVDSSCLKLIDELIGKKPSSLKKKVTRLGKKCPKCGSENIERFGVTSESARRKICGDCNYKFIVKMYDNSREDLGTPITKELRNGAFMYGGCDRIHWCVDEDLYYRTACGRYVFSEGKLNYKGHRKVTCKKCLRTVALREDKRRILK